MKNKRNQRNHLDDENSQINEIFVTNEIKQTMHEIFETHILIASYYIQNKKAESLRFLSN
jgi:hypothetical protein